MHLKRILSLFNDKLSSRKHVAVIIHQTINQIFMICKKNPFDYKTLQFPCDSSQSVDCIQTSVREKVAMNRAIKSSIVIIALMLFASTGDAITVEQMQQATEPVRIGKFNDIFLNLKIINFAQLVCIQKSKVSEASLENMRLRKLDESKELKCYVNCVLEMMQLVSASLFKPIQHGQE